MHAPVDLSTSENLRVILEASSSVENVSLLKISDLISDKIKNRQYFYGIEISSGRGPELDYSCLQTKPLFTAVTWLGDANLTAEPIQEAPSLRLAKQIRESFPVLSHLSCYKLTNEKLENFFNDGVSNILAVRGDFVEAEQSFKYASDLVREIRRLDTDNKVSVFVGGYPEVHPEATSREIDLNNLKNKVECGADAIITQICFSENAIKQFIGDCRELGIQVPIIPGIFVPHSFRSLNGICNFTKVSRPEDFQKYEQLKDDKVEFQKFSTEKAIEMIRNLFQSDLNICGVHFFTLNEFNNVKNIIKEIF